MKYRGRMISEDVVLPFLFRPYLALHLPKNKKVHRKYKNIWENKHWFEYDNVVTADVAEPEWEAKQRQDPVTVCGHGVSVYCDQKREWICSRNI